MYTSKIWIFRKTKTKNYTTYGRGAPGARFIKVLIYYFFNTIDGTKKNYRYP